MLALVACTMGVHKVDRANRVQWKREHINLFYTCTRWGRSLSNVLSFFAFAPCWALRKSRRGQDSSRFMASGSDVKFTEHIRLSLVLLKPLKNLGEGEIKIHGEREGCQIYRADQPLIGNSLTPKTLHQSHPRHGVLHFDQVAANHMQTSQHARV